jgi:hypothetical protein
MFNIKLAATVQYGISKMKNSNEVLNPFQIFWGIVEITEGKLTSNQAKHLSSISGSPVHVYKNHLFFHGAAQAFDERFQNVLNNIALTGVSGKMYKITDKQFGMIKNTYNSTIVEVSEPFKHSLVLKDDNHTMIVPLTEKQINEVIEF